MSKVTGNIILPGNSPELTARKILIEARDTSVADAPSELISEKELKNISIKPNGKIKFQLDIPEIKPQRSYSIRVHVDVNGSGKIEHGDLLTTAIYPLIEKEMMSIPVTVV